jgi:hypothetical protein
MKSHILKLLILALFTIPTLSAKEKVVRVHQKQIFFVNSSLGNSRIVLDVKLPPNTIKWFYSFSASRSKESISSNIERLKLFEEVSMILDKTGTVSNVINLLSKPPGQDYCSTFLLHDFEATRKFKNKISSYKYSAHGTRENLVSGNVEISQKNRVSGTQYLGFRNSSIAFGINVAVEVIAIVDDGLGSIWTKEEKNMFFFKTRLILKQTKLKGLGNERLGKLSGCITSNISRLYSYNSYYQMASYERESAYNNIYSQCYKNLGFESIPIPKERFFSKLNRFDEEPSTYTLVGKWKDNNSIFILYLDRTVAVKYDGQNQTRSGTWGLSGRRFHISLPKFKIYEEYEISSYSYDSFGFNSIKNGTSFFAKRL